MSPVWNRINWEYKTLQVITQRRLHLQLSSSPRIALPLKTERIGCCENLVTNYQSTLRNIPEERRSWDQPNKIFSLFHCVIRHPALGIHLVFLEHGLRCLYFSKTAYKRTPQRHLGVLRCRELQLFSSSASSQDELQLSAACPAWRFPSCCRPRECRLWANSGHCNTVLYVTSVNRRATGRFPKMFYPLPYNSVFIWLSALRNYLALTATESRLASYDEDISRAEEFVCEGRGIV